MKFKDMNAKEVLRAISDIIKELIMGADEEIECAIRGQIAKNGKLTKKEFNEIESAAYQAYKSTFKRLSDNFIDDDFLEYSPEDIIMRESNIADDEVIYDDDTIIDENEIVFRDEDEVIYENDLANGVIVGRDCKSAISEIVNDFIKNRKNKNDNNEEEC